MLVYLASTSPRRQQLLLAAAVPHRLVEPGPEPAGDGAPRDRAVARARSKACGAQVTADAPGLVVGVDTVVEIDGQELGKPRDADEAAVMLGRLAGRSHLVHTAVCVRRHPEGSPVLCDVQSAAVRFAPLDGPRIRRHVESGLWQGKAGGYGIQDQDVAEFATLVDGDLDTVIGLPMRVLRDLLDRIRRESPGPVDRGRRGAAGDRGGEDGVER
jgi:septum formation protein